MSFFELPCNLTAIAESNALDELEDTGDEEELSRLWLIGLGTAVLSSFATALGTILQKKAHNVQQSLPEDERAPEFCGLIFNYYWMMALVIMVLLPLPLDLVSFSLAPQSVVAPMTGLTIIVSTVLSVWYLGEKLKVVQLMASGIILAGVILVISTSQGNPEELDVCELILRYDDLDFAVPALGIAGIIVLLTFLLATGKYPDSVQRFVPQMYAFIAGGLVALMNILFKATGSLVVGAISGEQVSSWNTIFPYLHILGVIVLAVGSLSALNQLLSRVDAVVGTPLYFTNLIICSSILGLVFYREYDGFSAWQWVVFPIGLLVVCGGVLLMSLYGVDLEQLQAVEGDILRRKDQRRTAAQSFSNLKNDLAVQSSEHTSVSMDDL